MIYQITFTSKSPVTPFILFETENQSEAEEFFKKASFDDLYNENLFEIENHEDCSQIELKKIDNAGEVLEWLESESKIQANGGWIIKSYSK